MANQRSRILVVDDDPASLELVTIWLQSNGYAVARADDGNRAIAMGTDERFDLVILDVNMPAYDGIEVLQFLRKRHVRRPVKVIALTGDSSEGVHAGLSALGVDGYLVKPVEPRALLDEVQRLLEQASQSGA